MKLWLDLKYRWVFFWSGLGLLAERFWDAFWPAVSVAAAFAGLALLNLLHVFGPAGHAFLLFLFIVCFVLAATRLGAPFRFPRAGEVRRAIERESGLRHRPLETLLDRPAPGTPPEAQQLWQKYQERVGRLRERAKTYRPQPEAGRRDPWSLRIAAAFILVIGLVVAQHDAGPRLREALRVDAGKWVKMKPVALDAWITPPDYTLRNPVFLATTQLGTAASAGAIEIPEGSVLKVRLSGYDAPPKVTYGNAPSPPFTEPSPRSFTMEMPLTQSGVLKIRKGWFRTLGEWPVTVTADAAPELAFIGTQAGERATLKIRFRVKDDYGIKSMSGTIMPTEELRQQFGERTIDFDIPVPEDLRKDEQVYTADLARHPWAGAEVMLSLAATDAAGRRAETAPQKIILPERSFKNPVAQRIIAERKRLIWFDNLLTQRLAIDALTDIATQPQNFRNDLIIFTGLRIAANRLSFDGGPDAVESTVSLLWDLAVRAEDGGLSLAARDLSEALEKLAEGLRDKSLEKEKLQELMDQVAEKMRDYMKTMMAEMQQRMQQGNQQRMSPELAEKLMKHIDMKKFMEQLQQLTQGSEREQMEKMARLLKDTVDRFDPDRFEQMQESQRQAMEALEDLQKIIERQEKLLDRTNKMPGAQPPQQENPQQCTNPSPDGQCNKPGQGQGQGQSAQQSSGQNGGSPNEGQPGETPDGQAGAQQGQPRAPGAGQQQMPGAEEQQSQSGGGGRGTAAEEQGDIRGELGDVMRKLGGVVQEIPDNFPKADQSMKGSQKALKDGDPRSSAAAQREALDNLRQGQDSLIQQMARGMEAMMSFGLGGGAGGGFGAGFDPLGREEGNGINSEDIIIPDEKERRRVQQIIEELRARSNDYQRPKIERDYIDRLLEQFD